MNPEIIENVLSEFEGTTTLTREMLENLFGEQAVDAFLESEEENARV